MADIDLSLVIALKTTPLPFAVDAEPIIAAQLTAGFERIEKELHGGMDGENTTTTPIAHNQTRKGALAKAWTVSGTASLDWGKYLFTQVDQGDWDATAPVYIAGALPRMEPLPGANKTFFLRDQTLITFTWTAFWVNDIWDDVADSESHLAFYVDGVPVQASVRSLSPCTTIDIGSDLETFELHGYKKNRQYTGHYMVMLEPGEHTAGLRIFADHNIPNTRTWTRSMTILGLPRSS